VNRNLNREIIASRLVCKLTLREGLLAQESAMNHSLDKLSPADEIAVLRETAMIFAGTLEAMADSNPGFAVSMRATASRRLLELAEVEAANA
jgi:hypothetical protein